MPSELPMRAAPLAFAGYPGGVVLDLASADARRPSPAHREAFAYGLGSGGAPGASVRGLAPTLAGWRIL